MYSFPGGRDQKRAVASIALVLLVLAIGWLGLRWSQPTLARDYEECVDQVMAEAASEDERRTSTADCNARFAGRRKPGGGYTYFDFMQNRNFDIAGPNPTADERKRIDREYMGFLDAQRREALSAELAGQQNERLRADMERARQPVGPPLILTPKPAAAVARRAIERSKTPRCEDGSLSCSWLKLTSAVKNSFAASPKAKR